MVDVIQAVVDEGELEIRGVDKQQQVSKCEGQPSKKQNLILSKESTPTKDTGTTVTRPQSQFNSEQSIESDNVSNSHFPFCPVDEQRKHGGCDSGGGGRR